MPQEPANPDPAPTLTAPEVARRFGAIVFRLTTLIGRHFYRHYKFIHIFNALMMRLGNTQRRVARAMENLAAGRKPRLARPRADGKRNGGPTAIPLPRRHNWIPEAMGELRHEGHFCRQMLEQLLAEPGAAELIKASPATARALRPFCNIMGLRSPLIARPRAARRADPKPRRPRVKTRPAPAPPPPAPQPAPTPSLHFGRFEPSAVKRRYWPF